MDRLKILSLVFCIFLCICTILPAQDEELPAWEKLTTTGDKPSARMDAKVLLDHNAQRLFVTCGTEGISQLVNDSYVLDLETEEWMKLLSWLPLETPLLRVDDNFFRWGYQSWISSDTLLHQKF